MEKVNDKTRIAALLQKLLEQRVLITIKVQDQPSPFTSAIIEVNRDEGLFVIDELKPEPGNELLKQHPEVHIQGQLGGVLLSFSCVVQESGVENDIPFYRLLIPAELDYHQRRQAVRVKLSAATPLPVTFTDPQGKQYAGEVEDLSIGGLRARFSETLPQQLEAGGELSCSFLIPPENKDKLNCKFIVRVIKHEKEGQRPAFLGGQFVALEKQMERRLQRAIMTLQRASRQKESF